MIRSKRKGPLYAFPHIGAFSVKSVRECGSFISALSFFSTEVEAVKEVDVFGLF